MPTILQELQGDEGLPIAEQFERFEAQSRKEFDETGWKVFIDKIVEFQNSLYVETRKEAVSRADRVTTVYSGKDVERATMILDFQRYYARKRRKHIIQLAALVLTFLSGVCTNWAFLSIEQPDPSPVPWMILTATVSVVIVLSSVSLIRDMEP